MEKKKFFGKILQPGEEERVQAAMQKGREDAWNRPPRPGEIEMTEEEMKFIEKMNLYLQEGLKELGVKDVGQVPLKAFLFLNREKMGENDSRGFNTWQGNQVVVNKREYGNRTELYFAILHEMVHALSFQKFYVDPQKKIHNYRMGYMSNRPGSQPYEHLRGLNEALTDKIAFDIWTKHQAELAKEFNFTNEELAEPLPLYYEYNKAVGAMVGTLADKKREDKNEVWRRYEKTIFSGDILHLRDIDKYFGKGSLRVLGVLGYEAGSLSKEGAALRVLRYFKTSNDYEKDYIAKEILAGRDLEKYLKMTRGAEPVFSKEAKYERVDDPQNLLIKAEDDLARFENNFLSKIILLIDRMNAINAEIKKIEEDAVYDEKRFSEYQKEKVLLPAGGSGQAKPPKNKKEENLFRKKESAQKRWNEEMDAFLPVRSKWSTRIHNLCKELEIEKAGIRDLNEKLMKLEVEPEGTYKIDQLIRKAKIYFTALDQGFDRGTISNRGRILTYLHQLLWKTG